MTQTLAGWYDDGSGTMRFWDGTAWTDHVAPKAIAQPAVLPYAAQHMPAPTPGPAKKSRVGLYVGLGIGGVLLLVIVGVVALLLVVRNATSGPRDAFDDVLEAWQDKDCEAEYAVLLESTEADASAADYCATADYSWVDTYQDWEVDVTGVQVENATATVTTTEDYFDTELGESVTETWEYSFERVDGSWYLAGSQLAS